MEKKNCLSGCLKENKKGRHAEFISASHLVAVLKRGEILKSVQDDNFIFKGVGPVLRPYGAPLRSGFTLIELLVVVLIIGILSAVALPQYQKAVEKSKAVQAQTMLKTVYNAAKAYQLANGSWPTSFDELAVDIPWTGNTLVTTQSYHRTKSNEDWSLVLAHSDNMNGIWVIRNSGKYANAGFVIPNKDDVPAAGSVVPADQMLCVEGSTSGGFLQNFLSKHQTGDYCGKIMKGKEIINTNANRHFIL